MVSRSTSFESGIPPAAESLVRESAGQQSALDQLELVLVESTRAEANLGLMLRGLKSLASGATAAREANALLVQELESLRARVSKVYESESSLEESVRALEAQLDEAARERDAWFEQEDEFLAGLLTEHEEELQRLQREHERKLAELEESAGELRAQRDHARTEAARLTYERDTAVALLNEPPALAEGASTPPAAQVGSSATLGALKLKPMLQPKSDLASRPLVGYSLAAEEVLEERLEGSQRASRPPET
jgi:uncharacterized protein YhaN